MKKSILFVMIAVIVLMLAFSTGCGRKDAAQDSAATSKSSGERTVTDAVGRTVKIPGTVEKIVPLGNTPRMITYLGLAKKVVGIGGMDMDKITPVTAYAFANKDLWANVPIVGTDAGGATDYYPEQIIAVNPDVIFCSYNKELADEIQSKTGLPVVAVPMGTLFEKDYEKALYLIADVCGVKTRAEEVISYINKCLKDLKARTSSIPVADKPSVLGAAATFKGAHGIDGVYTKYAVFEAISANDVTQGVSDKAGGVLIDKEQILGWNPQYIFFDSGGVGLVKKEYSENTKFFKQLTAVQKGNLYQYPSSTSYYSNVEIPLVNSYFVAGILYPEQFKDIAFEKKANEIFKFFLGVNDYLSKLEDAGAGYKKITLGEK